MVIKVWSPAYGFLRWSVVCFLAELSPLIDISSGTSGTKSHPGRATPLYPFSSFPNTSPPTTTPTIQDFQHCLFPGIFQEELSSEDRAITPFDTCLIIKEEWCSCIVVGTM